MRIDELPVLEQRTVQMLTSARTWASVVTLAEAMWRPDVPYDLSADPVGLVEMILEQLAEKNLVVYRINENKGREERHWTGLALNIRLTREGWTLAGYPNLAYQVLTGAGRGYVKAPDRTNFRTHHQHAEGDEIERMPFAAHVAKYPDHPHPFPYDCGEDDMSMRRPYVKVTPEVQVLVIGAKAANPLSTYAEIADITDVPERSVKYILTDLPRLRRTTHTEDENQQSLKQRIRWALEAMDYPDVPALRMVLGRADTEHDIVHVLHSLHKEGVIDFTEYGPHKQPVSIHLRRRSNKPVLMPEDQQVPTLEPVVKEIKGTFVSPLRAPETQEAPRELPSDILAGVDLANYPLLQELVIRESDRVAQDNRALRWIEAAELLKDTDPETAAMLEEKAVRANVAFPSPVESEYLKFAYDHRG